MKSEYEKQDNPEVEKVRQQLYYLRQMQAQEKQAIDERRQKKEEEKRLEQEEEEEEEEEKKKKEKEKLVPIEAPKGKIRESIFSFKRKKKTSAAELKPGQGKQ